MSDETRGPVPPPLSPSAARVAEAARALGLAIEVREGAAPARTAEEAAAAVGCPVVRIVKSLVFGLDGPDGLVLLLVSGANRVDEASVGAKLGGRLSRAAANEVRAATGFAVGGIPPFGHRLRLPTYLDADLLAHPTVWAAAGTPYALFEIAPADLTRACAAAVIRMTA